jgi:NADH:ubiquinone oxidoreductase subunit C
MDRLNLDNLLAAIQHETGCVCEIYEGIKGDKTIIIPSECLKAAVEVLLASFDYCHLSAITVQVREEAQDEIEVFYNFWVGRGLSLMITLPLKSAQLTSIISIIPGADFYEREAAEMFGIEFVSRSETPPMFLPDEWDQGPPFISKEQHDG